jgi:exosortase
MADQVSDSRRAGWLNGQWILAAILMLCLAWVYWPALGEMAGRWSNDPRYSHGYLVPLFAFFLLWYRRDMLSKHQPRPQAWGLALVLAGMGLNLVGVRYFLGWFEGASIMLALAGLCVLMGGWPALRWAWPAIGFLFFMIPLPWKAEQALGAPLQWLATRSSTYALQTLGLPAVAEGNIILLTDDIRIGVVEACNGLGMLMMFFAYACAAALIVERPLLDRILIVLSAVPIALFANILRITVTGFLYVHATGEIAHAVYHDLAGWLMMPLALAILWFELWLLSRLLVEPPPEDEIDPAFSITSGLAGPGAPVAGGRGRGRALA